MMDDKGFGEGENFDQEEMEDAADWEKTWDFYADDYVYTVVWELTEGPEELSADGSMDTFMFTFPDDEVLMLDEHKLSVEISIFSYEYPWVWHYQEFKDLVTI